MTLKDCRDNEVSTASRAAVGHFDRAADLILSYRRDPMAALDDALREDPNFVMAHALRACMLASATERGLLAPMHAAIDAAAAASGNATDRERAHIAALRAWEGGDLRRAVEAWGRIVIDHPRDTVALQFAHLGDFYLGQAIPLRDRVVHALSRYGAATPGYGYLLGMHAFGLEETGLYGRAEESGRRAVELNAADAWAVHAVTHVMEMQGRGAEGEAWLDGTASGWSADNMFAYHNWWHLTLFHLERLDHAAALGVYDTRVRPAHSTVALEMLDGTALLWRLHLRGADVGNRWTELADKWTAFVDDRHYVFNDVHAMFAFTASGRDADATRLLANVEGAANGTGTNADMTRDVGLPLCQGIRAFGAGRNDEAVDLLLAVRPVAQRFGGSHAQRDIVSLTLIEAAHRAGQGAVEAAIAAERLDARPDSPLARHLAARVRPLT